MTKYILRKLTFLDGNYLPSQESANGIAAATIPDVCKTPSSGGPVPVPYPNIARFSSLAK